MGISHECLTEDYVLKCQTCGQENSVDPVNFTGVLYGGFACDRCHSENWSRKDIDAITNMTEDSRK